MKIRMAVVAGNEKEGAKTGVHFHPALAQCQSTDYQLFYVLGHGFHATTVAKRL